MDRLVVDNIVLDLDSSTPFPLDLSIMDLLEPNKRQRNRSKQITLPGTQSNLGYFYSAFGIHITGDTFTFDATQKVQCSYYKNDIQILNDAVLRLIDIVRDGDDYKIKVEIYGESVDVFLLLSEINVSDLDWSAYDHVLSRANIKASWLTASGSGYRYPLIERGNGRAGTTIWNTTDLVPYVHMVEVITKMFDYLGIEIDSNFLGDTMPKNLLWGYGGGDYINQSISPADVNERKVDINAGDFTYSITGMYGYDVPKYSFSGLTQTLTGYDTFYNLGFRVFDVNNFTYTEAQDDLDQFSSSVFTVAKSGNYQISCSGIVEIDLSGGNTFEYYDGVNIRFLKNGASLYSPPLQNTWLTNTGGTTFEFDFDFSNSFYLQSGDVIQVMITLGTAKYSRLVGATKNLVDLAITTTTDILFDVVSIDSAVTDGSDVLISRFLPEMKCSEFLMGFIKQFYMTLTDPDINGVMYFEPLVDYYTDTNDFEDISELIDHDKNIVIKPSANSFQKRHLFTYKDNKDTDNVNYFELYGKKYGDYTFEQGSFYAKGDNKIELPWSNIVPYDISGGILVPRFVIIDNQGGVKGNKGNSRVMLWNGLKDGTWTFRNTDNPSSYEVLTTYPCVHHFDDWENPTFDLNFQLVDRVWYDATVVTTINTYTEFYSVFYNEMTSNLGRIIELYLKWNENDVRDRDFSKLLMWDGALFRLNWIREFDTDKAESCKIQLIKVLEAKKKIAKSVNWSNAGLGSVLIGWIGDVTGVGSDTGVIIGGTPNSVSVHSGLIKGK